MNSDKPLLPPLVTEELTRDLILVVGSTGFYVTPSRVVTSSQTSTGGPSDR
jgi:hypothetical protein